MYIWGGKFVSPTSKTKALHGENRKKQAEKVLATVVMGMNLVNTTAPVAALAAAEQITPTNQPLRSEAAPLDYAVLPQLADWWTEQYLPALKRLIIAAMPA